MFPLVKTDAPNPTGLFQIWLNLPAADKMVEPHFKMLWRDTIPCARVEDDSGRVSQVLVYAGGFGEHRAPAPPPHSWASREESDVAIWSLALEPGARVVLPTARAGSNRALYVVDDGRVSVDGHELAQGTGAQLVVDREVTLAAGDRPTELLVLQGRPIGEPVVQYGPFVMNSPEQIQQAIVDYRRTGFGGWPWESDGPVHARDDGRFAVHADGKSESAS